MYNGIITPNSNFVFLIFRKTNRMEQSLSNSFFSRDYFTSSNDGTK